MEIVEEVVIVGAGICGLTTALGLHRFGIPSLVLESSDKLRATGFGLTTWENAWKALDAVGIGDFLRENHTHLERGLVESTVLKRQTSELPYKGREIRCIKRTLLMETLAAGLPSRTIRFSSKVVCIEEKGLFKLVHLADGSTIKTKVLIGCDGINSVVAKWLGFDKAISTGRSAFRGYATFKNGHGFKPELRQFCGKGIRTGFAPCDDHMVYWFLTWFPDPNKPEEEKEKDPVKLKQFVLNKIEGASDDMKAVIENTAVDVFATSSPLRIRRPWDLLRGNISKGNVCIAGDALHPMTPDLGQGGCSALEDSIVLSRCLAEALVKPGREFKDKAFEEEDYKRIEVALNKYARERRWRSFDLVSTSYIVGYIQQNNGKIISFFRDKLLSKFLSQLMLIKSEFDCGKLNVS